VRRRRNQAGPRPSIRIALLLCAGFAIAAPAIVAADESADSQRDQAVWAEEATRTLPPADRLQPGRVAAILAAIETAPKPPDSWWERFTRWLESWLRQGKDAQAPNWLIKLLQSIPPEVARAVGWALLAALVIGLAAIVIVELRAAGVFRRRDGVRPGLVAGVAAPPVPNGAQPGLAEIARLPLRDQPAALLQLAIRLLIARQLLPADSSLTNGELLAVLQARAPAESPRFRRLARAAEAAVYGSIEPSARETRDLLDSLRSPAVAAE